MCPEELPGESYFSVRFRRVNNSAGHVFAPDADATGERTAAKYTRAPGIYEH